MLSMSEAEIARRTAELCAAPAGCVVLLAIEESGLTLQEVAQPLAAAFLAALAAEEISPWFGGHDRVVAMALAEGPRLLPLARELLAQPAAAAWFAPLERNAQQWVAAAGEDVTLPAPMIPNRPMRGWEQYAQKSDWGLWTSTELDDDGALTSFLACVASGTGDIAADFRPPFAGYRLTVDAAARVFEIAGPRDWHRLCTRYPAAGDDGRLVPEWSAVAADWDGVHLTLGGLLASEQVRIESGAGWSEHWAWDAEQTVWLRGAFTDSLRLPDLTEVIAAPDWIHSPRAIRIEPGPDTWPWLVSRGPGAEGKPVPWDWPFSDDGSPPRLR